jgi:Domain of Unknown Function (DUF928)
MIQNLFGKHIQPLIMITVCCIHAILLHNLPAEAKGSAGDRGNCASSGTTTVNQSEVLTSLIPDSGQATSSISVPKLWFYIPFASNPDMSATLTLLNKDGEPVAESKNISLPKTASIVSLRLPVPLKKNIPYKWILSVSCGKSVDSSSPNEIDLTGWIQWLEPDAALAKTLKNETKIAEKAKIYIREGYWFDALTLLAEERDKDIRAKALWAKLLKGEKMEHIINKPIRP